MNMTDTLVIQQQAVSQIQQLVIDECKDIIPAGCVALAMDMLNSDEKILSLILMIRGSDMSIYRTRCSFKYPTDDPANILELTAYAISDVVKKQVRANGTNITGVDTYVCT